MITADSITDEQIRELWVDFLERGDRKSTINCGDAMGWWRPDCDLCDDGKCARCGRADAKQRAARTWCAEILNSRTRVAS